MRIGEDVIPLIDTVEIKQRRGSIKTNIPLIGLDEIGKKTSLAAHPKKNKKQTTKHIKERETDEHREHSHERWLIFRTTLAPNIRLLEQFIYDDTGVLEVSSRFIGDKRRINLPIIDIDA